MNRTSSCLHRTIGLLLAIGMVSVTAQVSDVPHGMYCGGNQLVRMGSVRAARVTGTVMDVTGTVVSQARIQMQLRGSDKILEHIQAGQEGNFRLPRLRPGRYWLGVSAPGFNLHFWELEIDARAGKQILRVELSLGT